MPPAPQAPKPGAKASRDAKLANAELQELMRTKSLESNEVQFGRQQLRRHYHALLFQTRANGGVSPGKMLDILNLLWMDTSHAFIARYRAKIAQLDKSIADNPSPSPNRRGGKKHQQHQHQDSNAGPVARRRFVQSFRSFLSAEEQYWTELLVKVINTLNVPQAAASLQALGISASVLAQQQQANSSGDRSRSFSASNMDQDDGERASQVPDKVALLLCHKALISLGDLARYRELYNDERNSNAGHGSAKKGKRNNGSNNNSAQSEPPQRNYSKAAECYNQARLLVPEDGQPFNQLAVLASYANDQISSVYHYFRALCVMQDFKSAKPNLEMTLSKALKKYEDAPVEANVSDVQLFSADFVALQAMIYLQRHEGAVIESQLDKALGLFRACLSNRLVSSEMILKVVCTCIAAWHNDRMPHAHSGQSPAAKLASANASPRQQQNAAAAPTPAPDTEAMGLRSVLAFLGTTFKEAADSVESMFEGKVPTEPASREVIASRIAPVLRRSLPAIRTGSKWLLSRSSGGRLASYGAHVSAFWNSYAAMVNVLAKRFPTKHLPDLPSQLVLEENIDLAGFMPLSGALKAPASAASAAQTEGNSSHPNMEHLMRIADVLSDAALIASSNTTPVVLERGLFSVKFELNPTAQNFRPPSFVPSSAAVGKAPTLPQATTALIGSDEDEEEDEVLLRDVSGAHLLEESHFADDSDVVDLAMRAATIGDTRHNQENLYAGGSPMQYGSPRPVSMTGTREQSPQPQPRSANVTAEDHSTEMLLNLLNNGSGGIPGSSPRTGGSSLPVPMATSPHRSYQSPAFGGIGLGPTPQTGSPSGPSIWGPVSATALPAPSEATRNIWNSASDGSAGAGAFGAAPLRRDSNAFPAQGLSRGFG